MTQNTHDPELDDPFSSPTYDEGKNQALTGGGPARAEDPLYMIGYERGRAMRRALDARAALPEDGSEPPPRRASLPSVTELTLKLHELKRGAPSLPPVHAVGPERHEQLLIEQAERASF